MELLSLRPLLWLIVLGVILAVGLRTTLVDRSRFKLVSAFLLRALGVVLLIVGLCRPFGTRPSEDLHVVFLFDVSQSIDLVRAREALEDLRAAIGVLEADDGYSLFALADGTREATVAELEALLTTWAEGNSDDRFRSESRVADALLGARFEFPAGKGRRIALFSDGQGTAGDLRRALDTLAREGIDVRFRRLAGLGKPEAAVVSLVPSRGSSFRGEVVRLTATLASNRTMPAKLRILHRGVAVHVAHVQLRAGDRNTVTIDVPMSTPGESMWTAELDAKEDHFAINNQASCVVSVHGKPRVLILHERTRSMRPFARALREQGFEVDVRGGHGLPRDLREMLAFDAIVLAEYPATAMSARQMELLRRYVMDFGGGLAMFGSDESVGLGGRC